MPTRLLLSGRCLPLLFIDTNVHLTSTNARFMYGKELVLYREINKINKATIYLDLNRYVPHVQAGTRHSEDDRNQLDQSHRQTLHHSGIKYYEIKRGWQERFKKAVDVIKSQLCIPSEIYKVSTHFSKTAKSLWKWFDNSIRFY